ncbi:hypothetical protein WAI453_001141 [Rhynchosporium graminicola]
MLSITDPAIFADPWVFTTEHWVTSQSPGTTSEDFARRYCDLKGSVRSILDWADELHGENMCFMALKLSLATLILENEVKDSGGLTGGGNLDHTDELKRRPEEYQMTD